MTSSQDHCATAGHGERPATHEITRPTGVHPERDAEIDRLGREHTPAGWRRQDDEYRAEHLEITATARLDEVPRPERSVLDAFFGRPCGRGRGSR